MMIRLVLVSLSGRWLQEYLRAGAGPTLETEAGSFIKESSSPEAGGNQPTDIHQDPPFGWRVTVFKSLSCTHHLLCRKQSCVLGKAGIRIISIIRVRTARLRGRYRRSQHQPEAESEPLA